MIQAELQAKSGRIVKVLEMRRNQKQKLWTEEILSRKQRMPCIHELYQVKFL